MKHAVEQQDLFEESRFPSAHMPTVTEVDGGLAAAFYAGTHEGHSDVCIWFSRYENSRWTSPRKIADGIDSRGRQHACWDPKIRRLNDVDLLLLYSVGQEESSGMMTRSSDLGQTWSQPRPLTVELLPKSQRSPVEVGDDFLILATDQNSGWPVNLERLADGTFAEIRVPLVTYPNGRMQLMVRNSTGTLQVRWSEDRGQTWGGIEDASRHANSWMDAVRLNDDRVLLIYNPGATARDRWPLSLAVTTDGYTWEDVRVLEAEKGRYSGLCCCKQPTTRYTRFTLFSPVD